MAQTHELKTNMEFYPLVIKGIKTFEVRKNDRNFQIGDLLYLKEWDSLNQEYTGRCVHMEIKYLLSGGQYGIAADHAVLGIGYRRSK